ncbi:hypothetical protein [Cohnella cellulosilytica]|uniref:Uncharacterized protein n=1 Tax=Cohnella cellulosilytica TaxID=986710 RepID=A0ABW2F2N3_9BACL
MNNRAGIWGGLLMLIFLPACAQADLKTGRAVPPTSAHAFPEVGGADVIVIREAMAGDKHFRKIAQGGIVYVEDMNENKQTFLYPKTGKEKPAFESRAPAAAAGFVRLDDSGLVDPLSLSIGIQASIPYTYDAVPDQTFVYLETLKGDGWEVAAFYSDAGFLDYYLRKNEALARMIVLDRSFKVLYPIRGGFPEPLTFVSDG